MRDVIEVLAVLEEVYNHLYAWCLFVHEAAATLETWNGPQPSYPNGCSLTGLLDGVPHADRLCIAQIEVHPPVFVEIAGARKVLHAMREYLAAQNPDWKTLPGDHAESVDFVRREVDLLCGLNFSKVQIQEALSKHIVVPLARLGKLRGIKLHEEIAP